MKTKFLFLALLGLFFGAKTHAQTNPCDPDEGITFVDVANAGGIMEVYDYCTGKHCSYTIPTCGNEGETICLNGSCTYGPCDNCAELKKEDFENGCIKITVHKYDGLISNSYWVSYNAGTGTFTYSPTHDGDDQSTYHLFGYLFYDLVLTTNANGTISITWGDPAALDDNGQYMVW